MEPRSTRGAAKGWKYLLNGVVLLGLAAAAVKYVDWGQFWHALQRFEWSYLAAILACGLGSSYLKGLRFCLLLRQVSPVRSGVVMRAFLAGQACSVLPGGITVRAGLLYEAGVPVAESAPAICLSGLFDWLVLLAGALLASLWFEPARLPVLVLLAVLALASLLVGLRRTRDWLNALAGRWMERFRIFDHWTAFLAAGRRMLTLQAAAGSALLTVLSCVPLVVAVRLCLQGLGTDVDWLTATLAFALPSLLGRISALPAGVGVTEASMVGLLTQGTGVTVDQAIAAVAVFRFATVLFEALFGAAVYLFAWRGAAERDRAFSPG